MPIKQSRYKSLQQDEQQTVRQIAYILKRFSVSLEAYHELAQLSSELARSYLVEGCQKVLDEDTATAVTRTPGSSPGAELPLKPLLQAKVKQHVCKTKCNKNSVL